MKNKLIVKLLLLTLALISGITGFVLMFQVDWRIALGVFLFVFGNNLSR